MGTGAGATTAASTRSRARAGLSLRRRFALTVMSSYLVAAVLAWFAFGIVNRAMFDALALSYAEKQALFDNASMRQPIVRELALTRQLTLSPTLLRWAADEQDTVLRAAALAELEVYRQTFRDHSWFYAIDRSKSYYYNDRDNTYAGRYPAHYLSEQDDNDVWYFETMRKIDDYALNVDYDAFSRTTKIWINAIVSDGGRKIGVAGTGIDLSEFLQAHVLNAPENTTTVLIDGKGATQAGADPRMIVLNALAHSDAELKTYYQVLERETDRAALRDQLERVRRGERRVASLFVELGGVRHLIAATHLPEIDWYNLSVIDLSRFHSEWQAVPLLVVSASALLLGVVAVALLLNRMVLRRLEPLFDAADRMAVGDYQVHVPAGEDEIGRLGGSFARMAAAVRETTAELERRVDARTAELREQTQTLQEQKAQIERAHAELQLAQQQLVLQEKMASLGVLTAGVAHEINNPTNFADGAVQNLVEELQSLRRLLIELAGDEAPPEVLAVFDAHFARLDEMTATAREGHRRISAIVRDLRQFTRLDEARYKRVPIAEPIRSTVNLVRTRFDRIAFVLDLAFNPDIECQPAKLGQVFMNLVLNACEAIGQNSASGRIELSTRAVTLDDRAAVEIVIGDNGCGMDAATRARIFEPFFTTKDVGAGTGLGLAIVFGIVHDHGGRIDVESTPGAGTRFRVQLPLMHADAGEGDSEHAR